MARIDQLTADAHARARGESLDSTPRRECSLSPHAPAAAERFRRPPHLPPTTPYHARDMLDYFTAVLPMQRPVLQDWVCRLPFMQQGTLLTAIRGPDGARKFHPAKPLLRWYRRCVIVCAFDGQSFTDPFSPGGGSFTGPVDTVTANLDHHAAHWPDYITHHTDAYLEARDELPHHFQLHAMHAFEIVGYKHPDERIRNFWFDLYERIAHAMHLWPESLAQMDKRLGDDIESWMERADVSETRGVAVTCSD